MVPISSYYLDQDPPNASSIRDSISKASQSATSTSTTTNQQTSSATEEEPQTPSGVPNIDASIVRAGPAVIEPMHGEETGEDDPVPPPPASKDQVEDEEEEDTPPRPISRDQPQNSQFGSTSNDNEEKREIRNGEHDEEIRGNGNGNLGEERDGQDSKEKDQDGDFKTEGSMDDVSLGNENEESPADQEIDL